MKLTEERAVALVVRALSAVLGVWLTRDSTTTASVAVEAAKGIELYIKGEDDKTDGATG